ncbi:uncharacterized protein LOC115333001 [Ixodes scapularis]|uniref:uncharacterized protein LOC115333001 n=1 Tax=Ixodes scapularis TaxID=6945 RepID=UPI001A9FF5E0|nr:uncharacterized protein LOC115333001 [Ixodes scapularis]
MEPRTTGTVNPATVVGSCGGRTSRHTTSVSGSSDQGSEGTSSKFSNGEPLDEQAIDEKIEALHRQQAKPPIKEPKRVKPSDFGRLSKNACSEGMTKLLFSLAKIQVDDIPERVPNETDRLVHSISASLDALFRLQKSAETLRELTESSSTRHEDFMRRLDELVFALPCYLEN